MSKLPPDTRAERQVIFVGLISFVVGFVVTLAALAWLMMRFGIADEHWGTILHLSIIAFLISLVLGGLGFAAISMQLLSRYHFWCGVYRRPYCDRPLKGIGILCVCPEAQALKS